MSYAVALKPSGSRSQRRSLLDGAGGEPTLDDVLAGVWEGLAARATSPCPICGGPMEATYGGRRGEPAPEGARAGTSEGARCRSCGSAFS